MLGGELSFHLFNTVIITAIVAAVVLWRYRHLVLVGMKREEQEGALPFPNFSETLASHSADKDFAKSSRIWESFARKRIACVYLLTTASSGLLMAAVYLIMSELPHSPAHFALMIGIYLSAAVPMISISLAIPFWRAVLSWIILMLVSALFMTFLAMIQRPFYGKPPSLDQFMNVVFFFQLAASQLWLPLLLLLATGAGRIRGVAPITFAVLLVFGLAPFAGSRLNALISATTTGSAWLLSTVNMFGLDAVFLILALPAGWLAWLRLQSLGRAYADKRFSDAQLLARTWWLLFTATVGLELITARPQPMLAAFGCVSAYAVFPIINRWLFAHAGINQNRPAPRTLLLLRVFGFTKRTEKLFDRIAARWRLHGPVTMIAAPDVIARTIDPADFLGYVNGKIDESFVCSENDLKSRLASLDLAPDPDGRYRINEFCCRDSTWQATVTALMSFADAVVMDLRGLTAESRGCEFEMQQLGKRVPPGKIILIVDQQTDTKLIDEAIGKFAPKVQRIRVEKRSNAEIEAVFDALLEAAST